MGNINIRNVSIRNIKCGWGDKVTWVVSTFKMLAFEIPSVECKDKQRTFEVKVSM